MKKNHGKGKGSQISGIPMPNELTQYENLSAEPNRKEPQTRFDHSDRGENYAEDYFDAEEARLADLDGPVVANKVEPEWSEGMEDEQNSPELFDDEGLLPETQPLHVDLESEGEDDNPDFILSPDNIDQSAA